MASEIKQLRSSAIEGIARSLEAEGSLCSGVIARDIVDSLISASCAEGVAAERERIIRGSERLPEGTDAEVSEYFGIAYGVHEDNIMTNSEVFIVPASVLSPAPKEDDNGNR